MNYTKKYKEINYETIYLQPFSDFSVNDAKYIQNELKKYYPYVEIKSQINLPRSSYYSERNRYRADSLIVYLANLNSKGIICGMTNKDISTTKGKYDDWGVMGLGFCPGESCVTSTFRVDKSHRLEQFFKVVIHEIGHNHGLPHCTTKTCIMRDAEGGNPLDEEIDFCQYCFAYLKKYYGVY